MPDIIESLRLDKSTGFAEYAVQNLRRAILLGSYARAIGEKTMQQQPRSQSTEGKLATTNNQNIFFEGR